MKLEIELDLNKIDYDAINRQIAEKVAALDIKDMYAIESRIDDKISNLVREVVDNSYNDYICRYLGNGDTDKGRKLIESMTKAEIENRTKQIMEEIFTNVYNEDALREIMLKIMPDVFSAILFKRMEAALFTKEFNYYERAHDMVKSEIDSAIDRLRY